MAECRVSGDQLSPPRKPDLDRETLLPMAADQPVGGPLRARQARECRERYTPPQAGRRARIAWTMVPSSSQSRSPPTGTPRARDVTATELPLPVNRSAI